MRAEHAPEARRVAPNPWVTLSVHVVASPGSHGALEGGGLSVHSLPPRGAVRRPRAHGELGGILVSIPRSEGRALYRSGVGRVPFRSPFLLGVVPSQCHLDRRERASRASPLGLGEGFCLAQARA